MIGEPISLDKLLRKFAKSGELCSISIVLTIPSPLGWWKIQNGTIKIQLAKIVDAYSLPWPKALVGSPQPKVYSLWEASFVSL